MTSPLQRDQIVSHQASLVRLYIKRTGRSFTYPTPASGNVTTPIASSSSSSSSSRKKNQGDDDAAEVKRQDELDAARPKKKFYITTAISYTNGNPHFGHAYESVTTDVIARYHRLNGDDVFFLTGTDEHGQKVEQSSKLTNRTPQEHCDYYAKKFQDMNAALNVTPNRFIRTTSTEHKASAVEMWRRVARGTTPKSNLPNIYLGKYEGYYNRYDEQFITKAEADLAPKNEAGQPCDALGRPYEKKEEPAYFFRMSEYLEPLKEHIDRNPYFIQPPHARAEILSFLTGGLDDLCISRTTVTWGIETPKPETLPNHTIYVWFDALTNYITGVDGFHLVSSPRGGEAIEWWPADVHIIGKDITRFHTVYWPTMLMAAGVPLPRSVFAHGFVTAADGQKMGKSLGNARDPIEQLELYGTDALRYYMARQSSYGYDLPYNEAILVSVHNDVLLKGLGNLVQRTCRICAMFSDSLVPSESPLAVEKSAARGGLPFDLRALKTYFESCFAVFPEESSSSREEGKGGEETTTTTGHGAAETLINNDEQLSGRSGLRLRQAVVALERATNETNVYLDASEPWKRKGDEHEEYRRRAVRGALEGVYALAHFFAPFIPGVASQIFDILSTPPACLRELRSDFQNLEPNRRVATETLTPEDPLIRELAVGEGVKARAEDPEEAMRAKAAEKERNKQSVLEQKANKQRAVAATKEDPFHQLDVRVGRVLTAERREGTNLLLQTVDVGEGRAPLKVASGIANFYEPGAMVGRTVVLCVNLEPFTPKAAPEFTSQGMLLSGKEESAGGRLELLTPPGSAALGARVGFEGANVPPTPVAAICRPKTWEKIKKGLKIDAEGRAVYHASSSSNGEGAARLVVVGGEEEKREAIVVETLRNVGIF